MTEILGAATVITPLVVGFTGLIKTQVKNYQLLPVVNVIAGILLGAGYAISFTPHELILYVWAGAVAGLAAGGLFDLGAGAIEYLDHTFQDENLKGGDDDD